MNITNIVKGMALYPQYSGRLSANLKAVSGGRLRKDKDLISYMLIFSKSGYQLQNITADSEGRFRGTKLVLGVLTYKAKGRAQRIYAYSILPVCGKICLQEVQILSLIHPALSTLASDAR